MAPHVERMVAEATDLDGKIVKLRAFLGSLLFQSLPEEDRNLMVEQLHFMERYFTVLSERAQRAINA